MALDLERIMILMQRRYNSFCEIGRLTEELQEAIERNDQLAAFMLLEMRGEEMAAADVSTEQIWMIAEEEPGNTKVIKRLMNGEVSGGDDFSPEEEKICHIRRKTKQVIQQIQETDRRINRSVCGDKSCYP